MGAHDRNDRLERALHNGSVIPHFMMDDEGVVLPQYREKVAELLKLRERERERDDVLLETLANARK